MEAYLSNQFSEFLISKYPGLQKTSPDFKSLLSPQMLSPYTLELPKSIFEQVQAFVQASFKLRDSIAYQNFHLAEVERRGLLNPGNFGICMSYDFHLDENLQPQLIEINTNAAFLALGYEYYQFRAIQSPVDSFKLDDFKKCLEKEIRLGSARVDLDSEDDHEVEPVPKISIIDDQPPQQRLFAEFLLFQELFRRWGFETEIIDFRDYKKADLVYNRHIDFYFENQESAQLKEAFYKGQSVFSPNPYEYLMLADKQRLIEWWDDSFWNQINMAGKADIKARIQKCLPKCLSVNSENAEEMWSARKKLFFKPKRAYGSKQSYKGSSMSRRVMDDILAGDFIAQEYVPAPEFEFSTNKDAAEILGNSDPQTFKYDLRFYAYQDQIQMVIARLYQGQVTNAKTLGGGFAPVIFK